MRARQLTGATERRALAACLANILDAAEEREADPSSRLVLDHAAVIASRSEIEALIALLRGDAVLDVRGVALARLLAVDRTSPLVHQRRGRTVQAALREVLEAL